MLSRFFDSKPMLVLAFSVGVLVGLSDRVEEGSPSTIIMLLAASVYCYKTLRGPRGTLPGPTFPASILSGFLIGQCIKRSGFNLSDESSESLENDFHKVALKRKH